MPCPCRRKSHVFHHTMGLWVDPHHAQSLSKRTSAIVLSSEQHSAVAQQSPTDARSPTPRLPVSLINMHSSTSARCTGHSSKTSWCPGWQATGASSQAKNTSVREMLELLLCLIVSQVSLSASHVIDD